MRKIWRKVTRKMAAQSETWTFAKVRAGQGKHWSLEITALARCRRDCSLSYCVKSFQTLHLNYSDQMAQFVFDIARHSHGMSDLLAQ
jgi:hypothetical protein